MSSSNLTKSFSHDLICTLIFFWWLNIWFFRSSFCLMLTKCTKLSLSNYSWSKRTTRRLLAIESKTYSHLFSSSLVGRTSNRVTCMKRSRNSSILKLSATVSCFNMSARPISSFHRRSFAGQGYGDSPSAKLIAAFSSDSICSSEILASGICLRKLSTSSLV